MAKKISNEEVCRLWSELIVAHAQELEDEADKGHVWHSLWTGFVIGLGRRDLSDWCTYDRLGFPLEPFYSKNGAQNNGD